MMASWSTRAPLSGAALSTAAGGYPDAESDPDWQPGIRPGPALLRQRLAAPADERRCEIPRPNARGRVPGPDRVGARHRHRDARGVTRPVPAQGHEDLRRGPSGGPP